MKIFKFRIVKESDYQKIESFSRDTIKLLSVQLDLNNSLLQKTVQQLENNNLVFDQILKQSEEKL